VINVKELKVYGGIYLGRKYGGFQSRMIVAGYTKKQISELLELPIREINNHWCETGNKYELEIANEVGVWIYDENGKVLRKIK
jgi:hypothetical protein